MGTGMQVDIYSVGEVCRETCSHWDKHVGRHVG